MTQTEYKPEHRPEIMNESRYALPGLNPLVVGILGCLAGALIAICIAKGYEEPQVQPAPMHNQLPSKLETTYLASSR